MALLSKVLIDKKKQQKCQITGVSFGKEIRDQVQKSHDMSGEAGTVYKVNPKTV
jgi:hypothetical protein